MSEQDEMITYKVVVNHEEQYSIWPADKENALGWQDAGFAGNKADALAYINAHWTDMRPLSLRQQMERDRQPVTAATAVAPADSSAPLAADPVATEGTESQQSAKKHWWQFGRRHTQ